MENKKFEYFWATWHFAEEESGSNAGIKEAVDELGHEGWELVFVLEHRKNHRTFYFKREILAEIEDELEGF